MNGLSTATQNNWAQNSSAQNNNTALHNPNFGALDRLDDGFAPANPDVTRDQWLDNARDSTNPALKAFYNELVTLAGGRTDNAALNQVLDRYQALQNASTASDVNAADKGMMDQVITMLNRYDPANILLDNVQPHIADLVRNTGAANTEWGAALQHILDTPGTASSLNEGLRNGILLGAKDMAVGTLEMAGKAVQYSADNGPLGEAGDWLREKSGGFGGGVLDSIIPSSARGDANNAQLGKMASAIGNYAASIADNPAKLKSDIANAIAGQWDSLKDSHAAAAAKGPNAEAKWWGEAIGRITFEVAATFIPVAGQAGKASKAAHIADSASDALRLADKAGDAAKITDKAGDISGHKPNVQNPAIENPTGKTRIEIKIPTIGGRKPINSAWAGKIHPSGIEFDNQGFPKFEPHAKASFKSDHLIGDTDTDFAKANKSLGLDKTPDGYTWHHHQDTKTLLLVPKKIHSACRHTGGCAVIRNGGSFD